MKCINQFTRSIDKINEPIQILGIVLGHGSGRNQIRLRFGGSTFKADICTMFASTCRRQIRQILQIANIFTITLRDNVYLAKVCIVYMSSF